jgi:hypothetical protein
MLLIDLAIDTILTATYPLEIQHDNQSIYSNNDLPAHLFLGINLYIQSIK